MKINNDTIIKDNNKLIREKSKEVSLPLSIEDEKLMADMLKYVKDSIVPEIAKKENLRPAVGISAVQVGVLKRMTAISFTDIDKNGNEVLVEYCLVNPKITSRSVQLAYLESGEGCLSVDIKHEGYVYRHARIVVEGFDTLTNKMVSIRARGFLAIVLQHELDHFDGILFYDHIDKKDPFKKIEDAITIS